MPVLGSHRGKGYSRAGVGASRSCCRRHRLWAPHKDDLGQVSSPTVCLGSAEPRRRMRRAKDSSTSWGQAETVRRSGTRPASASRVCKAQAVSSDVPKASRPPSPPQTWLQGTEQFQSAARPPPSSQASPRLLQRWDSKRSISRAPGGLSGRPLTQWETKRSQRWGCFPPCQRGR